MFLAEPAFVEEPNLIRRDVTLMRSVEQVYACLARASSISLRRLNLEWTVVFAIFFFYGLHENRGAHGERRCFSKAILYPRESTSRNENKPSAEIDVYNFPSPNLGSGASGK